MFLIYEFVCDNTENVYFAEKLYLKNRKNVYLADKENSEKCIADFGCSCSYFYLFPMEEKVLRQFMVVMICNSLVNIHTVMYTQYKYRDAANVCILIELLICFFMDLL